VKLSFNWWEQVIFLLALDAAWNAILAMLRSERRAIKALRWIDKKTAGKTLNGPTMATACMLYGLISVYGFFGAARFVFKLRRQMKNQNRGKGNGKRNR